MTKLDKAIFGLLDANPTWIYALPVPDQQLVHRRRSGATFRELALDLALTPAGVRLRLYGEGAGLRRHGGVLGRLHGMVLQERRRRAGA